MGRKRGVRGDLLILEALEKHGRLTMRQLQEVTGLYWNAIWNWLRNPDNKNNLVATGCVREVRRVDKTSRFAQDEYEYELTEFGKKFCIPVIKSKMVKMEK